MISPGCASDPMPNARPHHCPSAVRQNFLPDRERNFRFRSPPNQRRTQICNFRLTSPKQMLYSRGPNMRCGLKPSKM